MKINRAAIIAALFAARAGIDAALHGLQADPNEIVDTAEDRGSEARDPSQVETECPKCGSDARIDISQFGHADRFKCTDCGEKYEP